MTNITILLLAELFFLFVAYNIFKDILAPSVVSIFTFIVSTVMCIPMVEDWEMDLSADTIIVILVGLGSMIIGNYIAPHDLRIKKKLRIPNLNIPDWKVNTLIFLCVVLTGYYGIAVYKAGSIAGAVNLLDAVTAVKHLEEDDVQVDFIAKQGVKIVFSLAYVHLFIFIINVVILKKVKNNLKHIIPPLCLFVCCFLTGVRTDMLKILSAMAFIVIFFIKYRYHISNRLVRNTIIILALFAFVGSRMNSVFKGENANINIGYNAAQIIAYYVGSPIQILNKKIEQGKEKFRDKQIWGRTTFSRQYQDLEKFGIYKSNIKQNIGSVYLVIDEKRGILANVDTIIGPPLYDFGTVGMIVYVVILYMFFGWYYTKVKTINKEFNRNLHIILYSFLFVIPVMAYYACLPNLIFKFSYFVQIVLIYLEYRFYFHSATIIHVNSMKMKSKK